LYCSLYNDTKGVTRTLSFLRPMAIMGLVLDIVVVFCDVVVGTMYEESGRRVNMGLLCLLLHLVRVCCFSSSVVTTWGYKSERSPLHMVTSSRTNSSCLLASFLAPEEREREREQGRLLGLRERCFSFPLKPCGSYRFS
jgi:hypothetical protein